MNKIITVIQLLNRVANGEEVPKTVKYNEKEYNYHDYSKNYYYINDKEECLFDDDIAFRANDEVKILEDNTEEIEELEFTLKADNYNTFDLKYFFDMNRKVDEIRKAVNKLRKEKE